MQCIIIKWHIISVTILNFQRISKSSETSNSDSPLCILHVNYPYFHSMLERGTWQNFFNMYCYMNYYCSGVLLLLDRLAFMAITIFFNLQVHSCYHCNFCFYIHYFHCFDTFFKLRNISLIFLQLCSTEVTIIINFYSWFVLTFNWSTSLQ